MTLKQIFKHLNIHLETLFWTFSTENFAVNVSEKTFSVLN